MAASSSGLPLATWIDILDTTQLAINLDLETHKGAMFTNTISNNLSTDSAYGVSPFDANEVSGTGYTAGGALLTTTTVTESPTGTIKFDHDDVVWSGSTITNARALQGYADALAGNNMIYWQNFGADFSTVSGTFTVQEPAGGVVTIDVTP